MDSEELKRVKAERDAYKKLVEELRDYMKQ